MSNEYSTANVVSGEGINSSTESAGATVAVTAICGVPRGVVPPPQPITITINSVAATQQSWLRGLTLGVVPASLHHRLLFGDE